MSIQAGGFTLARHNPPLPSAGRGGPGVQTSMSEDLTPWKPSTGDPWDRNKAAHLFRRAGFGASLDVLQSAVAIGVDRSVDTLLVAPGWTIPTSGSFMLPKTGEAVNLNTLAGSVGAWLFLMNTTPFPLTEKMCLFWHDHFATGINKVRHPSLMNAQINIFRKHGLRNFRDLLIEVSRDPAMLVWLDNRLNRVGRPNENYGREIMELFSMGVGGGYTETDVQEAARCLTGFTSILNTSYFSAARHDTGVKMVLGRRIANGSGAVGAKDLLDLVDAILAHPSTSKYMVRKIWEYFVYEGPSQALVDKLALLWRQAGYDLRSLMEIIFRSRAFFSAKAVRSLVKNPVEYMVGLLRNLGEEKVIYSRVYYRLRNLYRLYDYDNPSGLRDGKAWIDSQALIDRTNFAKDVIQNRNGYVRYFFPGIPYLPPFDVLGIIKAKKLDTPTKIVDYFLDLLVDGKVPATVRLNLIGYMTTDNGVWKFTWNENLHGQRKGSGLIHLIQALPEAQMN